MLISRRNALAAGLAGSAAACASKPNLGSFTTDLTPGDGTFASGVASGDPAMDSVVLWTRIDGASGGTLPVRVEVAEDVSFSTVVWSETVETGPERDHTVKVVAQGLEPGRQYAYRFMVFDRMSPVGLTKTLPEETSRVRFAVMSCSNYNFGYFNAYDHAARDRDIDCVLHLGDYIYEYGPDGYGGEKGAALGRVHEPAREIVTLDDYRKRHRQYKNDPATRRLHAAHPMIAIWDDHETSNDSFRLGAENHQPDKEGEWSARKRAALQAYYEYMPVREPSPGKAREELFKTYSWGKFLSLPIIESRLTARDSQISYGEALPSLSSSEDVERFRREVLGDPSRELLGAAQQAFIQDALKISVDRGDTWRVIGNQVMMARVTSPNLAPYLSEEDIVAFEALLPELRAFLAIGTLGLPLNVDAWDGYPAARERLYQGASDVGARDLVVLTGDSHQFWANDLTRDDGTPMGVELGTSGITSPGASEYFGENAFDITLVLRRDNPDVRYTDPSNQGYILLEFNEDKAHAQFVSMSTIEAPAYNAIQTAAFNLKKQDGTVAFDGHQGLGFKERVLF
ncbi:MAG: alkaline phosphatase D family protein [Pseudomonadota bacterium]